MGQPKINIVRWVPRVFTIFLALFLLLFSLDVFDEQSPAWEMVLEFIIQSIPSMFVLVILWAAWNREWVGAVIFSLLGLVYFIYIPHHYWSAIITITLPLLINGILYQLAWINRLKIHPAPQS